MFFFSFFGCQNIAGA
uniref:Uncharacterized protein n=1 Tax=Anguilla anguilla TaxID=7936 RepID=A0A0E9U8A5_ANGAN